jgi:hypothetical protein
MSHQQKRSLLSVSFDARNEICSIFVVGEDLGGNAFLIEDRFDELDGFGFVSRWITRIDADEALKIFYGFITIPGDVRRCLRPQDHRAGDSNDQQQF